MRNAISILDGRNEKDVQELQEFYSEEALIFFRTFVEISWINFMSSHPDIPMRELKEEEANILKDIIENFTGKDAEKVKEIEKTTNHDVKAVEIFLREKFEKSSLKDITEWIHFACTSEDINNLAYAIMLKEANENVMLNKLEEVYELILDKSKEYKSIPMLARTHGQPASPTTMGKEFLVFANRLVRQINQLKSQEYLGKFSGATATFTAHSSAIEKADWIDISKEFVEGFGLTHNPVTTQIESHDFIAEISHNFCRINTILLDLSKDIWGMISFDFFGQKTKKGEVGSSVMPHKVNPIDFENAEGNLGIANSLFKHFADKLPVSRFQRDLSDSTVLRNLGVAFGHTLIALKKIEKGIDKLKINEDVLKKDLNDHPEVLAEAIQTIMRAEGIENPYDKLKEFTRGKKITLNALRDFIKDLDINEERKKWLLNLTPEKFTGLAQEIVDIYATNDLIVDEDMFI